MELKDEELEPSTQETPEEISPEEAEQVAGGRIFI
jgi:hypothetical protein